MKLPRTNTKQRKRLTDLRARRLLMEQLEPRQVLAAILPLSTEGDLDSSGGSVSADGRYVVFVSDATNLVTDQIDTVREGTRFKDVFLFDRQNNTTTLVSGSQGSKTKTADHHSAAAVISADGNYVAFTSYATDLVSGQNESAEAGNLGHLDLFLYSVASGETILVSHASGSNTTPSNNTVVDRAPSISADGRRIAFISIASNMVAGVTDDVTGSADVFLFDRRNGQTPSSMKLVTHSATIPGIAAGLDAQEVTLSADGNFVTFQSSSSDLIAGQIDHNQHADIFLYNATDETTTLVSGKAGSATETANGPSFQAAAIAISAHGRYVAFKSFATDLVPGQDDTNNNGDLFLFDRDSTDNRLRLISHSSSATNIAASGGSAASEIPVINVDLSNPETGGAGLFVAFQSTATNLVTGIADTGNSRDLFLYDVSTGTNTLITRAADNPNSPAATLLPWAVENGPGRIPTISSSGRWIAYSSPATNLVASQQDSVLVVTNDAFLFDRTTGVNSLLSGSNGSATQTGVSASDVHAISADGSTIVFSSSSSDLVSGDTNSKQDVFISVPPLTATFEGKPFDLLSEAQLNVQDGVRDAYFMVTSVPGIPVNDVTVLKLERGDGKTWSTDPSAGELKLGVANSIVGAIFSLREPGEYDDWSRFVLFAADAAGNSLFTAGQRFTLTAAFADGTSATVEIGPLPPLTLTYEGKLGDRVGRSEDGVVGDGRKDGTFKLTFPAGSGIVTTLDIDRGDGNRWNTIPNDSFWVLGAATSLDEPLLNRVDGTLMSTGALAFSEGGSLFLFVAEDRPEAASFFAAGKTFRVTVGFDDNSTAQASVTLTEEDIPPSKPDLFTSLVDSPDPVSVFGQTVYTASVRNDGDLVATHVQVRTDPLPEGVQFASANSPSNCELLSKRIVCTLDTIPVGAEKSVNIPLLLNVAGSVTIRVEASASEVDDNPANDSATATTTVLGNLQLTLTDSPDPVYVGEDLTYEMRITNPTTSVAGDVQVFSKLPEHTTFVSVSTTLCELSGDMVTCNLSQLDPDQSLPLRFVVRPQRAGTVVNNGAGVNQGGILVGTAQSITTTVRPANDNFAQRQQLVGSLGVEIPGSTLHATGEELTIVGPRELAPVDPAHITKSIWYEWTPTYSPGNFGTVTFYTTGSQFDTLLSVYSRLHDGSLKRIAFNDDESPNGPRTSRVAFTARSGVSYFISVDGYHGEEGTVALSWQQGLELQPGSVAQVVESINPRQVSAGTGPEVIVVRGTGFAPESIGLVNGQVRPTQVVEDGNDVVLAVQLSTADKALPGSISIGVRTGNAISEINQNSFLLIGNYETVTVFAGEEARVRTRSLLNDGLKPEPFIEWVETCDATACVTTLAVYRAPNGQFCDRNELCFPTLRQYQIAHGLYCDEQVCDHSLEDYRRRHNGEYPTDPAMPGAVVAESAYSVQITGTLQRGVLQLGIPNAIPDDAILIHSGPSSVVSNDGAGLLERLREAGLIGQDGASLIGQDGASLIGQDGASLIGQDGASLVGNDSGGEGGPPSDSQERPWVVVRGRDGNPATITNTSNPDGTTTATAAVEFDAASLSQLMDLSTGVIFAIVIPDKLQWSSADYTVAENDGTAQITVTRTGTSVGRVSVDYATADDTAIAGSDYTATSGTLTFETGEMTKTITIPIANDKLVESDEKFKLILSQPDGIVRIGNQASAVVSIKSPIWAWQNPRNHLDVTDDGFVVPQDALVIINELNSPVVSSVGGKLPATPSSAVVRYYDVSGDGFVAPIDALIVINSLNADAEGESQFVICEAIQEREPLPSQSLAFGSRKDARLNARSESTLRTSPAFLPASHSGKCCHEDPLHQKSNHDERDLLDAAFATFGDWE